ncbi:hypothetical protein RISK_003201 [Rhodopirellula islandica]|uniref:Uncharacterized protein n=1 Tax=Rhodopirellula islandica TaxID=595434 RepID=A0A0J1BEC3_RHOIS|nr:hypothetical protein RISK_003201 [Rhodopirellula islandica]
MGRSSVARGGSPETDDGTQQVAPDGAVVATVWAVHRSGA